MSRDEDEGFWREVAEEEEWKAEVGIEANDDRDYKGDYKKSIKQIEATKGKTKESAKKQREVTVRKAPDGPSKREREIKRERERERERGT